MTENGTQKPSMADMIDAAVSFGDQWAAKQLDTKEAFEKMREALGVKSDPISDFVSEEPAVRAALEKLFGVVMSDIIPAFRKPSTLMRLVKLAKSAGIDL